MSMKEAVTAVVLSIWLSLGFVPISVSKVHPSAVEVYALHLGFSSLRYLAGLVRPR